MHEKEQGGAVATTQQAGALAAAPAQQITGVTPMDMLAVITRTGSPDAAQLERLWALHVAHEEREAKKAYVRDMAEFKRNAPTITKDKAVGYANKDGTFTGYKHASLGNVTSAIVEGLAQHGFSHSWDVKQDGATAHVTCTITHRMGHAESVSMHAAKDDSGKKNAIQQVASAITYLQRYTLLAATGLAVEDGSDDDGAAAGVVKPELDVTQADGWITAVRGCKTIAELDKVWADGSKALLKKPAAYDEFKDAVAVRGGELEGK